MCKYILGSILAKILLNIKQYNPNNGKFLSKNLNQFKLSNY